MGNRPRLAITLSIAGIGIGVLALVRSGDLSVGAAVLLWIGTTALVWWLLGSGSASPASRPSVQGGREPAPAAEALVTALPGPALLLAPDDTVLAFNSEARSLMAGLQPGFRLTAATRQPDLLAAVRLARETAIAQRFRYEERVPIERRIEAVVAPVGAQTPAHLIIVLTDLTEIARTDEMRADFVANASHELRTPLAALKGSIETLQGPARNDPAARERFLNMMATQASRMTRLIDDLMSLSKIEMREHVPPDGVADVSAIVQSTVDALGPLAEAAGIRIELNEAAAPMSVRGDASELEQVVQNLVQNAIKYGRQGGHVRIGIERLGNRVAIRVADDGPGIAAEHLPRLTERFYRVDAPASRSRGGTGLGLAIVKHIVNRHRGELVVTSEPGKGSVFTAMLPAA